MTFTIPEGVRRIVNETFAEDEAKRYREESDKKLRDLQNTPMAKLGPDEPLPFSRLTRPDWMQKRGYDTPDQEQPSTAAPTFVPPESDPSRDYSSLGASPVLTRADIAGDPIPEKYNPLGTGGPQDDGPLSEADIIELKKVREDRAKAGVRSSLMQQPGSPDDAAKAIEIAKEAGVDRSQVEQNRKSYEYAKTAKDIDALTTTAPKFRTWLDSARENLEVAHDDTQNLSWWEQAGQFMDRVAGAVHQLDTMSRDAPRSVFTDRGIVAAREAGSFAPKVGGALESGYVKISEGTWGVLRAGSEINDQFANWVFGKSGQSDVSKWLAERQIASKAISDSLMPVSTDPTERGVLSGFQSIPASGMAALASVMTGGVGPALTVMGGVTGGSEYGTAREQGLSPYVAAGYGLSQGLIEAGTEALPMHWLIGDVAKRTPFFEMLTRQALGENVTEQVATHSQDFLSWAVLPENADKPISEYLAERGPAAYETLIATMIGSGVQTALAKSMDASLQAIDEGHQERRAQVLASTFKAMADGAADSKLLKRLPDKYREAVAAATKDGPLENVRVAPEAFTELAQSAGVTNEQLAQAFRIDPNDIVTALDAGEDVVIPAGNYAAALSTAKKEIGVSGETIHSAFAPNMRLRADDFTAKEREAMKAVYEEEQKARSEAGSKEQSFSDSADRVRETIREQVAGLKIFNTEAANTQAAIIGEMVTTLAERTGQDPEALWNEQGFDLVAALTGEEDAGSLEQGLQRAAIEVDDATVLAASEKLPPHEFEVWKEAIKGGSNDQVTERLNQNRGPDNLMEPKDVARILSRIREKGFDVQKLRTGPALSPETLKIIDLKARGLDNAAIGKAVFPHLSPKERTAKARTASNNNRKAVDARRAELQLSQEKRGTFTPRVGRSVIRLFESANLSTLVHEASHWYLDTLWRMASIPAAAPETKLTVREGSVLTAEEMAAILNPEELAHPFVMEQIAAILEWQGKSPNWTAMFNADGTFTQEGRDIQEAFAETFEAYLREGKAPTSALRSVFASFKAWLLRIYKSLTQIGSRVKLNDEIRAVFDRMLATDEAIKAETSTLTRDSEAMAKALLEKGVITPKQVDKTRERLMAAKERAEAELMARLMEDYERNQKSWWKDEERQVRREVQSEIDERPEQRAYAWLSGKGWRATRAGLVEEAAAMADAMASLEQYDEALAFSRYYEPDATDENLKRLQERMRSDGVDPVIMLFKAPNGRVIAFQGSAAGYSHDLGREIMGLGDLKLQHGIYDPRKGLSGMQGIDWYATTGTLESLPKSAIDELAQFAPRNAQGAPIHSLLKATLMDIGGERKEDIWRATGWAQTRHGDWVWEIPGKPQFNFNPEVKAQRGRLDQMIEWPELFDAMPILRDVYLVASVGAQSGRFDSAQAVTFNNGDQKIVPLITARGSVAGSNTLMETIQHEIQHAIQTFSGFASTGATAAIEVYRGTEAFEKAKARFRNMEAKLFEKYGDASPELFEPLSEDEVDRIAALEVYSHNHGEWQARQIEWRSRMPAEWRWANPPGTEVPGTKEDVDERRTWATLADLRSAQGVQRSGDAGRNPAARVASALVGDQAPATESAGANDGQDNGSGSGSGSLAQRVGPAERAAEIQRVLDYLKANPEAARDVSLSALMAATDASAIGADLARRQFRQGVSLAQARRMAAIDAGVQLVREYLATHPNAFDTMRVGEIARAAGVPVEAVRRAKQAETGSLAQLSNAGISALREFVESPLVNTHVQIDNYEVYLRKARRVDETGKLVTTLDMASIQRVDAENASFEKGRAPDEKPGDFRELMQRLEQEAASHGFDAVYAENVFNEFLPDVLRRYGYTQMPGGYPPSFIKHVGSLNQAGDATGRTVPPPNLPPMRLNLQAVKEQYGEQALAALPPEIVAYSAAATDLDQFVEIAVDVRRSLKKKRPKSLWKFLSTRRVIGSGNDKIAYAGIRDEGGELLKIIGEKKAAPGLIADETKDNKRVRSYSIEHAAEAAWEAGYFTGPSPPTPAEFLDALRADVDGQAVRYSVNDAELVQERDSAERWEAWFDENGIDITGDPMFGLRDQLANVLSGQQEHAIGPDEAAEYFRMPDGNALLQGLKEGAKRNQLIREETQRRMIARHGDIFRDGTLAQEAAAYARNEIQHRQFEIELDALARATGQQAASNLAKQQAIENLRSKQVREVLNFNQWLVLERRWSKKAVEAAEKGDIQKAAEYARYRLINSHMYTEGRKLAEKIEASRKHILDYGSKTKQQRLYHAGKDYAEQMNGLLTDYQFRNETRKGESKRAARAAWLQTQMTGLDPFSAYNDPTKSPTEQMAEAEAAIEKSRTLANLADGVEARNYKSLTVDEMMGVRDEADMIWRLATLKDRLIKEGERRRLSLAAEDIAAEIETNQPNRHPREPVESDTLAAKTKRGVLKYFAMHRQLQSLARQFAGGKDGGQFWNYIVRPLNEAFARLALLRKQMGKDLDKLFSVYTKQERARFFKERFHFDQIGVSLTKQGRLAVALNWGNEKNRARLMDSTGWDEAGIQEVLDTLDKRDWDFVQSVWDYLDTWFPEANKVHEAVHGVPMDKVAPLPIATRFGGYKGGYYPIMFDPEMSSKAGQRAVEAETKGAVPLVGNRTQPGFGKKRVEGRVTLPLRLSVIDVVSKHLDQVATSIATEEAFFDAGRLLKQKTVEDAIVQRHGRQIYNTIINTIVTAKFGLEGASGILNHLRNGATVVGLGWKVATAALQPLGITNSIVRVGGFWIIKGYAAMGSDAITIKRRATWVTERSDFMKSRRQSQSPELSALRASMRKGVTPKWVTDNLFALMSNVQFYSVDVPTWYAGFFKAQAAGMNEADAIAEADQAVIDAQGGGEIHQTAAVQTGAGTRYSAALRLLTNFMSYMITTYNLATQRVRNARSVPQIAALSLDMILLLAVPVAGKMALDAWTKGGGGGDDDDDLWEKYAREQVAFLMSQFVGLSQIAGATRGDDAYGYKGPAGLMVFSEGNAAVKAAAELKFFKEDGTPDQAFWRPANKVAGMIFHYPAAQLDATVRGAMALWNGETTNPAAIFFGPPPKN